MGGKRKTAPRKPGEVWLDSAWQAVPEPPQPKNRKDALSVGLIETLTSLWKDAGLKVTYEISDTVTRGLRLRVQPRGPTYFCRVQYQGAEHRVRIGRIDAWGLAHARTACAAIVRHISTGNGVPSDEWIELQRQALVASDAKRKGKTETPLPHVPEVMPRQAAATTWTYAEARTAYVDWLKAEMAEGHLAPATVKNYSKVLVCPAVLPFDPKHVAHLGASDLAEAVERLVKEGKRNQANDVSRNLKRLFRWLAEPAQERRSGVRAGVMDRVRAPKIVRGGTAGA